MSGWFSKTTKEKRPHRSAPPLPFDLVCVCGTDVRIVRRESYQRVLCRNCGEAFFILPANPYPQPPLPQLRKAVPKGRERTADENGTETIDQDETARAASRGRAVASREERAEARRRRWRRAFGFVTPFRLVIVLMVAVVAFTGYYRIQKHAADQATVTFREATDAGYAALERDDLAEAAQAFSKACRALDVLERDNAESRRVRQMGRETRAGTHLAAAPLEEIVAEASEKPDAGKHFRTFFSGQWVVFDTNVSFVRGAGSQAGRWEIEYPLAVDNTRVAIEADLPALEALDYGSQPRRAIFAAQLDDCRLAGGRRPRWVVTLRGTSSFLWTDYRNYRRIGFVPFDDEIASQTAAVLKRQRRAVGLETK
jgi:hypothetical protein